MNRAEEERGEEQLRITSWDLDLSAGQCGSASGTTNRFSRSGSGLLSADCYLMNLNDDVVVVALTSVAAFGRLLDGLQRNELKIDPRFGAFILKIP